MNRYRVQTDLSANDDSVLETVLSILGRRDPASSGRWIVRYSGGAGDLDGLLHAYASETQQIHIEAL